MVKNRLWDRVSTFWLCSIIVALGIHAIAFAAPVAKRGEVLIVRNLVSADINVLSSNDGKHSPGFERVMLPSSGEIGIASETTEDLSLLEDYCHQLKTQGIAKLCSPNYRYSASVTPNDSFYSLLYGLPKISANEAWNITTGSNDVVVAVIDTGVQYSHPDLESNIWVNPGETPGDGIDNDGNGYVDDVYGFDFVSNDSVPLDENGHGTHVAGTIGAVGENNTGVVGVNQLVSIQALRVLDASGSGFTSDIIEAVNYATENGADIVNMSLGGPGYSEVFSEAISLAGTNGVLVVVAAGNDTTNNDATPSYPANYGLSNMITVAATNEDDLLSSFSNYGATTVQIAAPGEDILSTYPTSDYAYLSGTSMATPHVAGAAALIKATNPELTALSLRALILENGDDVAGLSGVVATGKRLNVSAAVAASIGATPIPDPTTPALEEISIRSAKVGSRKYRIAAIASDEDGEGVSDTNLRVDCTESGRSRRVLRRTGSSDSRGAFKARFTFSSRASRAICRVTAPDDEVSSRRISFKVRR